jgi:hypothetical protein
VVRPQIFSIQSLRLDSAYGASVFAEAQQRGGRAAA